MSTTLKVAIAGAAGDLGTVVLRKLLETPHFHVKVLRNYGSKSSYPTDIDVVDVDYTSTEALTHALSGQFALVSTVGASGISSQIQLIDACIAAGVKRFIPSDFGVDLGNPNAQKLPLFVPKVEIHKHLIEQSGKTDLSYTFIYNGSFLDWGFQNDMSFDILSDTPTIVGDGNLPFTGILLSSAGEAVVGCLDKLEATRNRAVHVSDFVTTQNKLLSMARRLSKHKDFKPVYAELDTLQAVADDRLAKGLYDMETFRPYIYRVMFDPAYRRDPLELDLDNKLLNISEKTEGDLEEAMQGVMDHALSHG